MIKVILFLLCFWLAGILGIWLLLLAQYQAISFQMDHPTLTIWGPPMLLVLIVGFVAKLAIRKLVPKKNG